MKASVSIERKAYQKGFSDGQRKAIEIMMSAMTLVLADEFGLDENHLVKGIRRFNEVFDSINENRITVFDIADTLREEYGIQVEVSK